MERMIEINIYQTSKMSHMVNPAVLKKKETYDECNGLAQAMSEDYRSLNSSRSNVSKTKSSKSNTSERYSAAEVYRSTNDVKATVYASEKPPAGQVTIQRLSPKTNPNVGSNEYYKSGVPGTMILRRYNNIFIPMLAPY